MTARGIPALALLLAGLGFVLFFRIGDPPPANPAEARVGAVVQAMVASGDWLVPRVDGQPRLHKPPGYYWLAAGLSSLAGETTWTSVRAGSVLATLVLVAVVFAWGTALGGPALGLCAAVCLSAMQFTLTFGRRGVAEMLLACLATLALASFDRVRFAQQWSWLPVFGLAFAGAILAKATVALLLVGLPVGLQLALERSWRGETGRRVLAWSGFACAAGFLWYALILAAVPDAGRTFLSEGLLPIGIRVEGTGSALHYRLPTDYIAPLLLGALPAALLLPLAIRRWLASRLYAGDPRRRFVALAFFSLLGALALIPQKQRHYLLPLLPLLALLLAEAIVELRDRSPQTLGAALRWLAIGVAPLGGALLVGLGCFYRDFLGMPAPQLVAIQLAGAALLGALLWSAFRSQLRAFAALACTSSLALMLTWFGSVNLWKRELEAGTAAARPDYHADRWQRASQEHPWVARFLHGDEDRGRQR